MSFQNKGFWMAKPAGCLNDGEMAYDNASRIEQKRPHQWFMEATEAELFPCKKQAIEAPNSKSVSGISNANVSPWENASSFQSVSGQFTDRLFGSDTGRAINYSDRNLSSVGIGSLNMGRKGMEEPYGTDSSVGLSMSHTIEDSGSCLSYGGIRKVKVNQVKDSENGMSVSMGQTCNRGGNNTMPMGITYNNRVDDNTMSIGHAYNKGDNNIASMGYNKGDDNMISMGHTFNKGDDSIISMGSTYKGNDNLITMGHIYSKGDDSTISMGSFFSKADNNIMSMGHNAYDTGASNTISFGGCQDEPESNPSGRLVSNYDYIMNQSSIQTSEALNEKELVGSNAVAIVNTPQIAASETEDAPKNKVEVKTSKKVAPNSFPSNVRSLLSTGMLDGVPVKYTSWSREKELQGVIKGSGYLCGCESCNYSKALNAYEFERHAGCKTKHPNNHIFFENGKTIYGIVQELRSTPQNMLFDAIQTVTGSPINQKSFRIWKESFQAATRELQRIYGTDEISQIL